MTHPLLLTRLSREGIAPETSRPAPEKLLAGDPVHTTWNVEDRAGLYCGVWHSTPGAWRVAYDEWEYCILREGVSILTDAQGHQTTFRAGDAMILRPGFTGTWTVVEATLKDYVILLR